MLAATAPGQDLTGFQHLLRSADQTRVRIFAEQAPFDQKDRLKQRGYRWNVGQNGRPRCWWTEIAEADVAAEIAFLRHEIYLRDITPRHQRITAFERFKAE